MDVCVTENDILLNTLNTKYCMCVWLRSFRPDCKLSVKGPKVAQKLPNFGKVAHTLPTMRLTWGHIRASNGNRYMDLSLQT